MSTNTSVLFNGHEPMAVYEWIIANIVHPVRIKLWHSDKGSSRSMWFDIVEGDLELLAALRDTHKHVFGYAVHGMALDFSQESDYILFKVWCGSS